MATEGKPTEGLALPVHGLKTVAEVGKLRRELYHRINHSHDYGEFTAWTMVGNPDPILRSFGVWHAFGENYGPVCAAKQVNDIFCGEAESDGFSVDICSYLRCQLGYAKKVIDLGGKIPTEAPYGGMGKPDMYIAPTYICDGRYKSLQASLRYYDVPYFVYEVREAPFEMLNQGWEVKKRYVEHYYAQLKELVRFLERVTGKRFDEGKCAEALSYWWTGHKALADTWKMRGNRPNPWGTEDSFALCYPYMNFGATKKCADFYQKLYEEVKYRVDNKIGIPQHEKYRLYWEGMPPYFYLGLYNWLEERGVALLDRAFYIGELPEKPNLDDNPLWTIAKNFYDTYWEMNGYLRRRDPLYWLLPSIKDWGVEGVVMVTATSCRSVSAGNMHRMRLLRQKLDIPFVNLDFDMTDPRTYSDMEVKGRLEAFLEMVDTARKKKKEPLEQK